MVYPNSPNVSQVDCSVRKCEGMLTLLYVSCLALPRTPLAASHKLFSSLEWTGLCVFWARTSVREDSVSAGPRMWALRRALLLMSFFVSKFRGDEFGGEVLLTLSFR